MTLLRAHGAFKVKGPADEIDLAFWKRLGDHVQAIGVHQEFAGQTHADCERSTTKGTWNWRTHLREEVSHRAPTPLAWDEEEATE